MFKLLWLCSTLVTILSANNVQKKYHYQCKNGQVLYDKINFICDDEEDCKDGFLACFWKRPEAYLQKNVRTAISTFSKIKNLELGLKKLESDLSTGEWHKRNANLLDKSHIDVGYRIITIDLSMNA